jgi:hypothetical protein
VSRTTPQDLSSGDEQRTERVHRVLLGGAVAVSADPDLVGVAGEPGRLPLAAARLDNQGLPNSLSSASCAVRLVSGSRSKVSIGSTLALLTAALGTSSLGNRVRAERVGGERAGGVRRHVKDCTPTRKTASRTYCYRLLNRPLLWYSHFCTRVIVVGRVSDVWHAVTGV